MGLTDSGSRLREDTVNFLRVYTTPVLKLYFSRIRAQKANPESTVVTHGVKHI